MSKVVVAQTTSSKEGRCEILKIGTEQLKNLVEKQPCPTCKEKDFDLRDDVEPLFVDKDGNYQAFKILLVTCANCGHMRYYRIPR